MIVMIRYVAVLTCILMLQGCITKIVTVPVKVAYGTTKAVVKGTAAVVGAVIPDEDKDSDKAKHQDEKNKDEKNKDD